jgi:hypothetical protein
MAAPVTVSERDLRTLVGIVSDYRSDLPAAGLPLALLAEPMAATASPMSSCIGSITGIAMRAAIPTAAAMCAA